MDDKAMLPKWLQTCMCLCRPNRNRTFEFLQKAITDDNQKQQGDNDYKNENIYSAPPDNF